jgi:hypothetical protein
MLFNCNKGQGTRTKKIQRVELRLLRLVEMRVVNGRLVGLHLVAELITVDLFMMQWYYYSRYTGFMACHDFILIIISVIVSIRKALQGPRILVPRWLLTFLGAKRMHPTADGSNETMNATMVPCAIGQHLSFCQAL